MSMKNFPRRLTTLRSEQGLTKSGFARAVGVTPAAVILWEQGKSYPRPAALTKIAHVLKTTEQFLGAKAASKPAGAKLAKPTKVVSSRRTGTVKVAEIVNRARREIADAAGVQVKSVKLVIEYKAA